MDGARAESDARDRVEDVVADLGLDISEIPEAIINRMTDRAVRPDQRLQVGRYLVVGEIGRGGMGVVYEAWDPGIERRVAIKTLEPDLVPEEDRQEVVERFRRETKIVGRLHHPAIVTIYDSGRQVGRDPITNERSVSIYYYVMEYLEGCSLSRALKDEGSLPEVEALRIASDIAEALGLAHGAGIIHRDIKPSNIFLRDRRQAVLLDFGIAKSGSVALTRQGQILGTPSYLAPERLREKEAPIDGRADIFSLGVLLYTMLTGEAPFVGGDVYEIIDQIAKAEHPKLRSAGTEGDKLRKALDRMLAKRPEDRFATAKQVAHELRLLQLAREQLHPSEIEEDESESQKTTPSQAYPLPEATAIEGGPQFAALVDSEQTADVPHDGDATPKQVAAVEASPPRNFADDLLAREAQNAAPRAVPRAAASDSGTTPELSLMRQTREIVGHGTPVEVLPGFDEGLEVTTPEAPPSEDSPAPAYNEVADESTDDETIADPHARVPEELRNYKIPRAHADLETEQVRTHTKGAPIPSASTKPAGPLARQKRRNTSRIEASLIDEAEVMVKPAPLSSLKPDELPTQTHFSTPQESSQVEANQAPEEVEQDFVKSRGASKVSDPAERSRGRREIELQDSGDEAPLELDMPARSAAVARRTIGPERGNPAARRRTNVRVKGDTPEIFDRSRTVRRLVFLGISAVLASIAVGLVIGRLGDDEDALSPEAPVQPTAAPRAVRSLNDEGTLRIIEPKTSRELIRDAETALSRGDLAVATNLFETARRVATPKGNLYHRATLGLADARRRSGSLQDAVGLYREVAQQTTHGKLAREAEVALQEIGAPVRRRPVKRGAPPKTATPARTPEPPPPPRRDPEPPPPPKAAPPPTEQKFASADDECRAISRANIKSPRKAVNALIEMKSRRPSASCVHYNLGHKYESLGEFSDALAAYRRFVRLAPRHPRRAAVETRIKKLEMKLR